jgi:hypothetical protein
MQALGWCNVQERAPVPPRERRRRLDPNSAMGNDMVRNRALVPAG